MKILIALLSVFSCLLLCSCVYSPGQLTDKGTAFKYKSSNSPKNTAKCISRTSDDSDPGLISQIRDGEISGTYEVIVRLLGKSTSTAALFKIGEVGTSTDISGYVSPNILSDKKSFINALVGNCVQ